MFARCANPRERPQADVVDANFRGLAATQARMWREALQSCDSFRDAEPVELPVSTGVTQVTHRLSRE